MIAIDYKAARRELSEYAKSIKLNNADVEVRKCISAIKVWNNAEEINSEKDLDEVLKRLKGGLRAKKSEKAQNNFQAKQTLCWTCENAVPKIVNGRYVRGCQWSTYKCPVPGWEAEENVLEKRVSYNVRKCPRFKRG